MGKTKDYEGVIAHGWAEKTDEGGPWCRVMITVPGADLADRILALADAPEVVPTEVSYDDRVLAAIRPVAERYRITYRALECIWYYWKNEVHKAGSSQYVYAKSWRVVEDLHNSKAMIHRYPEDQRWASLRNRCEQVIEFLFREATQISTLRILPGGCVEVDTPEERVIYEQLLAGDSSKLHGSPSVAF